MILTYFFVTLIILIIGWILLLNMRNKILEETGSTENYSMFSNINQSNMTDSEQVVQKDPLNDPSNNYPLDPSALIKCQVPSLNTEQCYKSRYFECPIVNGSHLQCTNNYIPKPDQYNADCGNRTFEMVPPPWKISENCYYDKIKFNRGKEFDKVKFV